MAVMLNPSNQTNANDHCSASSSAANDGRNNGTSTICHVLPCSIDRDITAPTAQYFHPTPLNIDHHFLPNGSTTSSSSRVGDGTAIMAAQFRGRGLLCTVDTDTPLSSSLPLSVSGALTTTTTTSTTSTSNNDNTSDPITKLPPSPLGNDMDKHQRLALSKLPSNIIGVVLSPSSSASANNIRTDNNTIPTMQTTTLKTIETFQHVYNWQHEHDVRKIIRERHDDSNREKYGLSAALGWCDLAKSIHDPIPLAVPVPPPSSSFLSELKHVPFGQ